MFAHVMFRIAGIMFGLRDIDFVGVCAFCCLRSFVKANCVAHPTLISGRSSLLKLCTIIVIMAANHPTCILPTSLKICFAKFEQLVPDPPGGNSGKQQPARSVSEPVMRYKENSKVLKKCNTVGGDGTGLSNIHLYLCNACGKTLFNKDATEPPMCPTCNRLLEPPAKRQKVMTPIDM